MMEALNKTQVSSVTPHGYDQTVESSSQSPQGIHDDLTVETPQLITNTSREWPPSEEIINSTLAEAAPRVTDDNNTYSESVTSENATGSYDDSATVGEDVSYTDSWATEGPSEPWGTDKAWERENTTQQLEDTTQDFVETVTAASQELRSQTEQVPTTQSEVYESTNYLDLFNETSIPNDTLVNDTSVLGNETFSFNETSTNETSFSWNNSLVTEDTKSFENFTSFLTNDTLFDNGTSIFTNDTSDSWNSTSDLGYSDVILNGTSESTSSSLLADYTSDWNETVSTETVVASVWDVLENVTATAASLIGNVTETDVVNASYLSDDSLFVTYDWLDENQSAVLDDQPRYVFSLQYYLGEMIVVTILLGILTLWTVIGNLLVLISLFKFKNLKTMSNYLIGNLAFCDFLLALTVLPLSLINDVLGHWLFGEVLCNIWLSIDVLYCTASIWSLCVIALDRFTATTFPVWYRDKRSLNRAMCYTAIVWIFSVIVTVPPLFGWQDRSLNYQFSNITMTYHCILFENIQYVIYSALGSFIIPLFLMLVLYLKIFTVLRKRSKQLHRAYQRNQQNRRVPSKKGNAERNRHPPQDIELSTISKGEDSKFLFAYSTDSSPDPDLKSEEEEEILSNDGKSMNSPSYFITDKDHTSVSLIRPELRNGLMSTTEATDSDTMVISNPSRFTETDKESQSDQEKVKLVGAQHHPKCHDSADGHKHDETSAEESHRGKKPLIAIKQPNPFKRDRLRSSFRKFDKREQRATKRMGMIISCFVICWMPFTLMYLTRALCKYCPELNPNLQAFIIWLGYANSGLNPILYTIFNEDFRKAFIKLVCCCMPWYKKSR